MIKHIVMWRLKDFANGAGKEENARVLKNRLESLKDKISEIRYIEIGINIGGSDAASDVVLYSEFDGIEQLHAYLEHPEHRAAAAFVNEVRSERRVVDYEF